MILINASSVVCIYTLSNVSQYDSASAFWRSFARGMVASLQHRFDPEIIEKLISSASEMDSNIKFVDFIYFFVLKLGKPLIMILMVLFY